MQLKAADPAEDEVRTKGERWGAGARAARERNVDIKQILLIVGAETAHESATSVAATLARRYGAVVQGVCLFHEPAATVVDSFAMGRLGIEAVLEHRDAKVRELASPAEAAFQSLVTAQGLSAGWEAQETTEWRDALVLCARLADLVVISEPGRDGTLRAAVERVLIESGTACLIVPAKCASAAPFRHVALGWNRSREARRAIGDAMNLLKEAGDVTVVVVGAQADADPIDEALVRLLLRHGVNARLRPVACTDRRVDQALVDEAAAIGADLLVMGAFGHSRAAETILGGATRTVLSGAPLPVLLSR